MKTLFAIMLVLLVGCGETPGERTAGWSGGGEYMGQLPDGRKVYCYRIDRGVGQVHYLYLTQGGSTVNFTAGKHSVTTGVLD